MQKKNVQSSGSTVSYGKRLFSSVMLVMYLSSVFPCSVMAEERKKSYAQLEHLPVYTKGRQSSSDLEQSRKGGMSEKRSRNEHICAKFQASAESGMARILSSEKKEKLIGEKGGSVKLDGALIEIPEGALESEVLISITRLEKVFDIGDSLCNVIPESGGYRFLPAGTKFKKDVVVTLPYASELNGKEYALEELYTYFYDTENASWVKLERLEVDRENCVVRSLTTHFTDMINATLTMPETPGPVDVNLNSIKNLEASVPDSHLIKFNPPEVNNMGDASFSFELAVPSGRQGMEPEIYLSYSSGGANGSVGKGFDVSFGSVITIDTRLGLPKYDTNDTYMLDGVLLYEKSREGGTDETSGESASETSGVTIYYGAQKENAFRRIVRYNAGTKNDRWEVTEKSGVKRFYEQSETSCVGSGEKTFAWNLSRMEDLVSNNVLYEYIKDAGYVYPYAIFYTGHGSDKGNYSVVFHYTDGRQDVRTDARSRSVVSCKKLLTGVTTHYKGGRPIRTYEFIYKEGLAKEKMISELCVSNNAGESYSYTFEYEEPGRNANGELEYFEEAVEWNNGKPLQLGSSTNRGTNFNASGGVGYGTDFIDLRFSGGGSGSVSSGVSRTEEMLIDIDGDGRVDSVKQVGHETLVALNKYGGFLEEKPIHVVSGRSIGSLDYEINSSSSIGWNIYGGAGSKSNSLSLGGGYSEVYQKSSTQTSRSFLDMDRDGLVDIVESGKSTYLKNMGNLVFEERKIESNVLFYEVKETLDADIAEKYRKTYFVQTPFRMWKAPYEGIVAINERAKRIQEERKNPIIAKTFFSATETDDDDLRLTIEKNSLGMDECESFKNDVEIKSSDKIYFIADSGREPRYSDLEWNVNIEYTDVKTFRTNLKVPFWNLKDYIDIKFPEVKYNCNEKEALEKYEEYIINDFLQGNKNLIKMFTLETKHGYEDFNRGVYVKATFDLEWTKKTSALEQYNIFSVLSKKGLLIPSVFTENQFNQYLNSVKENASRSEKTEQFYSDFALRFQKDVINGFYVFRDFPNQIEFQKFLLTYPIPENVKNDALLNYYKNGIAPSFTASEIFYETNFQKDLDKIRGLSMLGTSSEKLINIGKYNLRDLFIDVDDCKLKYASVKNGKLFLEEIDSGFEIIGYRKIDDSIFVHYGINKDKNGEYESVLKVLLNGKNFRSYNLSENEFQKIVGDIDVPFTSAYDAHWEIEENDENRVRSLNYLFEKMGMSEKQKDDFIAAMYEAKIFSSKDDEYTYYVLKKNPDYASAQSILDEYKKECVLARLFPFYEEANGEYFLKEEWQFFDEDNFDEEYVKLNALLLEKCEKFNFGKYNFVFVSQEYNREHLYKIENNTYQVYVFENAFNFCKKSFNLSKVKWNTHTDFSNENLNVDKIIFTFEKEMTYEDITVTEIENVAVKNDEFLYGGKNNFFYGIWKGSLTDTPFSESSLQEFNDESVNSEKSFREKQNSLGGDFSASQKENEPEEKIHFYLPQKQEESELVKDVPNLTNNSILYEVDFSKSLLGTIAMSSDVEQTLTGNESVTNYYMPFIYKDVIHSDRVGGDTYYKIEGISHDEDEEDDKFTMPAIRRTSTSGKDKTPTAKIGIGPITADFSRTTNSDSAKSSYNLAISLPKGNCPVGENNSTSESKQVVQDFNADGIPDLVQVTSAGLQVVEGNIANEDGDILFDNSSFMGGVSNLSKNEVYTKTYGGSIAPQGSVKQVPKINGVGNVKMVEVITLPSSDASGGLTYAKGTSNQTNGVGDINGDGILDYYNGNVYLLSNGTSLVGGETNFFALGNLSESKTQSVGFNYGVTIGTSGGKNLTSASSLKSGASGTVGVTYSASSTNTEKMMIDINGDGLQDILELESGNKENNSTISVRYNTGNGYVKGDDIVLPDWKDFISTNWNKFLTQGDSEGFDIELIEDIPVIGKAVKKGLTKVAINPFGFDAENLSNALDWNTSVTLGLSGNIGANVNIGFRIVVMGVYCGTINVTVSGGAGINASSTINGAVVKMLDLDGDGLSDHVLRIPGCGTYWKRNKSGKWGLLNKIVTPQGGSVFVTYDEKYGTVDNPIFKYVLGSVTFDDGTGDGGLLPRLDRGANFVRTHYEYDGGYYERSRKDFYGFGKVTTTYADGSYKIVSYENRSYNLKGCEKESAFYSRDGKVLSKTLNEWSEDEYVVLLLKETNFNYEKKSGEKKFTCVVSLNEYDQYGNKTLSEIDFCNDKKLSTRVNYLNVDSEKYFAGRPVDIAGYDAKNNLLRHRTARYDEFGRLVELNQYYTEKDFVKSEIEYDEYGNIARVVSPRGLTTSYKYDESEKQFVCEISQAGNGTDTYVSYVEYDVVTQKKTKEIDCNENVFKYKYDAWQRITEIRTSYDTGVVPSVSYEYVTPQKPRAYFGIDASPNLSTDKRREFWYSITNNKVTFDSSDDSVIQTVVQVDGLGRKVRTAKTGVVNGGVGWNASGAVEYDAKGRVVKEGMTEFVKGDLEKLLQVKPRMTVLFSQYEYDEKNRKVLVVLPDGSVSAMVYIIEENASGECVLVTRTTDPLGNVSEQRTNALGFVLRVSREDEGGKELTSASYEYDVLGQMLGAFDAAKNPIGVEYDLLGRRTALQSLDGGRQEFFYDEASNLVRENNSVLREKHKQIVYEYDGLNRLTKVDYPETKDTVYTYGKAFDEKRAANKIQKVEDASGSIEFEYGKLGEVVKETRTVSTHLNNPHGDMETSVTEYRSDYLGRMQHIVYPDGEKVFYKYDAGGQVVSVTGENFGRDFNYVTNILYDEYGQRTRIDYGNGTRTEYKYDAARRWLDSILTVNKHEEVYQNIVYDFDKVGNVCSYTNDCLDKARGNYKTRQEYEYDALYQLAKASGETTYNPYQSMNPEHVSKYVQEFAFDDAGLGNMTRKVSAENVSPSGRRLGDGLNYSFEYVYDEKFAHRLKRAGNRWYKYDANGNVVFEKDLPEGMTLEDDGNTVSMSRVQTIRENVYAIDEGWGLFSNDSVGGGVAGAGVVAKNGRRTYTWNERNQLIATVDDSCSTVYVYDYTGTRTNKYTARSEMLYFNQFYAMRFDNLVGYGSGQAVKHIYLGDTRIVTKLNSVKNASYSEEANKQYFYHSDHLGSASLISDCEGREYQRIEYTPYGETWVEKTSNTGTSNTGMEYLPYKFTGKERDEETGLYYFGARYLDAKYSRWLSTDPALGDYIPVAGEDNSKLPNGGVHNHVNLSLYHYSNNNPVKYADPDGKFPIHIVIGAVIGGVSSAAISMGSQLATKGEINVKETLISAGAGVLSGALAASGVGFVGQVALNATISAVQEVGTELSNGESVDAKKVGISAMVGAVGGALGGRGAETSNIKAASKQFEKRVVNAFQHKTGDALRKEVTKATSNYMKNAGLKQVVGETGKAIGRSTVPDVIKNIYDYKNEKGKHNENNQ